LRTAYIATEEAFVIPEIAQEWKKIIDSGAVGEPGYKRLAAGVHVSANAQVIRDRLVDVAAGRIAQMDKYGIDMQVVSLAAPGVQVLDGDLATDLARLANDRLAGAVRANPDRFVGLAAVAPQQPWHAAREFERAVNELDMRGAIINSHTRGEYLDEQKFWPIFDVAEALQSPIYLHPRSPSPQMIEPYLDYGLYFASWGFAAEAGLHAMRLILSGVFDEFPKLKIIIGHMGEAIPFWLDRIDNRVALQNKMGTLRKLPKMPSEYFKDNFVITTSGVLSYPGLKLSIDTIGVDRIMFAVDYLFEENGPTVAAMDAAPIFDEDRDKIYRVNAEQLFRLKG